MWRIASLYLTPLLYPLSIVYALMMKVLTPLGVKDFLGIMQTEDESEPEE